MSARPGTNDPACLCCNARSFARGLRPPPHCPLLGRIRHRSGRVALGGFVHTQRCDVAPPRQHAASPAPRLLVSVGPHRHPLRPASADVLLVRGHPQRIAAAVARAPGRGAPAVLGSSSPARPTLLAATGAPAAYPGSGTGTRRLRGLAACPGAILLARRSSAPAPPGRHLSQWHGAPCGAGRSRAEGARAGCSFNVVDRPRRLPALWVAPSVAHATASVPPSPRLQRDPSLRRLRPLPDAPPRRGRRFSPSIRPIVRRRHSTLSWPPPPHPLCYRFFEAA